MLNQNYKNALEALKAQGEKTDLFEDGKKESNHIYQIIMVENIPVDQLDEIMLEDFLNNGKDYSTYIDGEGLGFVDLEKGVEVHPYIERPEPTYSHKDHVYFLSSKDIKDILIQLQRKGKETLITDTLQSLYQKQDGTKLQTAFPCINKVKECIDDGLVLPQALILKIKEWEELNCSEINFDFFER